ncbi:hypothetical protein EU537_11825, partial [Candidatus Thorarchaeota archaeon]
MKKLLVSLSICILIVSTALPFELNAPRQESKHKMQTIQQEHAINELEGLGENLIAAVVRVDEPFTKEFIESVGMQNVKFSCGSLQKSKVDGYLLINGKASDVLRLVQEGVFNYIGQQTTSNHLNLARDLSIPEINADDVWTA